MFTVKQLSDMTGVTGRTLRYYDSIGLLPPSRVGGNGYRYYNEQSLLRLQQILFYREMDVPLAAICDIMSDPGFDVLAALQSHKQALAGRLQQHSMQPVQLFDDPRFRATFDQIDPGLAPFIIEAVALYVARAS